MDTLIDTNDRTWFIMGETMETPVTINPAKLANLTGLTKGSHGTPYGESAQAIAVANKQVCIMEAISYVCNLPWSDSPDCVDPWMLQFGIWLNDYAPAKVRDQLVPLIPKLVNSRYVSPDVQQQRYREVLRLTLDLLVERTLNVPSEQDWYRTHVLAVPDLDVRMENMRGRHVQGPTALGYTPVLGFAEQIARGKYPRMLPVEYATAVVGSTDASARKQVWADLLTIYDRALSIRDTVAEAEADAAEVASIERMLERKAKARAAAKRLSTTPEAVLVTA